jgi:hypothetical protein
MSSGPDAVSVGLMSSTDSWSYILSATMELSLTVFDLVLQVWGTADCWFK